SVDIDTFPMPWRLRRRPDAAWCERRGIGERAGRRQKNTLRPLIHARHIMMMCPARRCSVPPAIRSFWAAIPRGGADWLATGGRGARPAARQVRHGGRIDPETLARRLGQVRGRAEGGGLA